MVNDPLTSLDDLALYMPKGLEEALVFPPAADGDSKKERAEVVKRTAVLDENAAGNQFFPELGGGEA